MLVEDTTAFVERLEVARSTKAAERLKRRATEAHLRLLRVQRDMSLLEHELRHNERALATHVAAEGNGSSPPNGESTAVLERRSQAALERLLRKRDDAARLRSRHESLERRTHEQHEQAERVTCTYRLHSAGHHLDCSEGHHEQLVDLQAVTPVLVTTSSGKRWWWFLDRFWWDDEGLHAAEVREAVLEHDRELKQQRKEVKRLQEDLFDGERQAAIARRPPRHGRT